MKYAVAAEIMMTALKDSKFLRGVACAKDALPVEMETVSDSMTKSPEQRENLRRMLEEIAGALDEDNCESPDFFKQADAGKEKEQAEKEFPFPGPDRVEAGEGKIVLSFEC